MRFILLFLIASFNLLANPIPFALNWKPEPEFGGFYAAELNGNYKKHGLDVKLLPGGAGTPVVQMVAAGNVEFGISGADEVVLARKNGAEVVAVFACYQNSPMAIITHPERKFKDLKDVFQSEGILAIQQGLPFAEYLLKKYGPPKVTIVPYQGGVATFLTDPKYSQQGFLTSEPIQIENQGGKAKNFLVAESGYNPYASVLITRVETLKKNPKLVAKMVKAVQEGWNAYLENPGPANARMHELNPTMDPGTFRKSAEAQRILILTDDSKRHGIGYMSEARWQLLASQMKDLKQIESPLPAKDYFYWK